MTAIGKRLGGSKQRRVDRAADREIGTRRPAADTRDDHHRTLGCGESGPGGADQPHMAKEFEGEAVLPVGIAQGEEIATFGGAGIGDDDVDPAELGDRRLDQPGGSARLAQIDGVGERMTTGADNPGHPRPELVAAARGERHEAAGARELGGDLGADAAARAGDHGDLSGQGRLHIVILSAQSIGFRQEDIALAFESGAGDA
jgi:hypothetical protein